MPLEFDFDKRPLCIIGLIFLVAVSLRIGFIFFVSGPEYVGWYQDSFHHWQIAYYTLHVGLAQNPPRMWDLGGMEYFWGVLPTLIESFLLRISNSSSIVPFRIFNSVSGSLSACLIYSLVKKYFGGKKAIIASILAALSPTLIEVDTSGMLDPIGVTFLFAALLFYDRKPLLCGVFAGLASLTHIEFWFLALAICGCYAIFEKSGIKFIPSLFGWLLVMTPYFYFMQTMTGDPLYALRWNFLGNVAGQWVRTVPVPIQAQILARGVAVIGLFSSLTLILYLLKRRPSSYIVHTFFFTYLAMKGSILGLTAYILPYIAMNQIGRLLIDRLFALNHYYVLILGALAIWWLPKKLELRGVISGKMSQNTIRRILVATVLLANVLTLPYIGYEYFNRVYREPHEGQSHLADAIVSDYHGGTVVSSLVIVNYRLINRGIHYENVVGSIYCPRNNQTEAYRWLIRHNVTWIVLDENIIECFPAFKEGYPGENHPPFYRSKESIVIYFVNQTELASLLTGG